MPSYRVQRTLTTFSGMAATVTPPIAVDATKGWPRVTSSFCSSAGRDTAAAVTLRNIDLGVLVDMFTGTDFRLARTAGAEAELHRFYTEAVEWIGPDWARTAHGVWVRTVSAERLNAGVATSTTAAVPGIVDLGQTMIWQTSSRSANVNPARSDAACTLDLTGLGEVTVTRGGTVATTTAGFAVLEWGAAWRVRHLTGVVATRGVDVALTGAGAEPWSQKLLVASWRTPAGADNLADSPTFRANLANPDEVLVHLPAGAAGSYPVSVYVLHHPLLAVEHRTSYGGMTELEAGLLDAYVALGTDPGDPSGVSVIAYTAHDAANTDYPIPHYGYELDGDAVHFRRGRSAARGSDYALQVVRWPEIGLGSGLSGFGGSYYSYQRGS